jgi:hypothetical protein
MQPRSLAEADLPARLPRQQGLDLHRRDDHDAVADGFAKAAGLLERSRPDRTV